MCSMVLESSANSSQNNASPKKVAFVALGEKLSKTPTARTTGEIRTEKYNKTADDRVISLLRDIQTKISSNKRAGSPCFDFSKSGTCRFGDGCRFVHHEEESGPPRYPVSPKKRRNGDSSSSRPTRECFAYQKGTCRYGNQCTFLHNWTESDPE